MLFVCLLCKHHRGGQDFHWERSRAFSWGGNLRWFPAVFWPRGGWWLEFRAKSQHCCPDETSYNDECLSPESWDSRKKLRKSQMSHFKMYLFGVWTHFFSWFFQTRSLAMPDTRPVHCCCCYCCCWHYHSYYTVVFLYNCFAFGNGETRWDLRNPKPTLQCDENRSGEQKLLCTPGLIQGEDFVGRKIMELTNKLAFTRAAASLNKY